MSALDKKLFRDLSGIWGQALAIALVLAAGIATLVLANGAYRSLYETREAYYERYRFADLFATARRMPAYQLERIAAIPGVSVAQARIQSSAILDIPGLPPPATAQIISLPVVGQPRLNALYMREGRLPDPLRDEEVVVNEAFAKEHGFRSGNEFRAILHGNRKTLRIVGIALSPEFIYALGPGDLVPDDRRFGVVWMGKAAAEAAFDQKGAYNSITLKLMRDARPEQVLQELDALLERYGGRGGFDRDDQQSHAFVKAELEQLQAMSFIIPPIFLAVAAFLINMTLARLISMEREQIGLLKALGYSNVAIALHYMKFVSVIAIVGMIIGIGAGVWLGRGLTRLYGDFYHFPFLVFVNPIDVFVIACLIGLAAAWGGSLLAVSSVIKLSPAVAMAPPVPTRYGRSWVEYFAHRAGMSQMSMMILRHLARFPVRAGLTIIGIAMSGALLVMSLSSRDSVEKMINITFFQSTRQDITVGFDNLKPERVALELARLPGVLRAEPYRSVAVTLRNGTRSKRVTLQAVRRESDLQQLLDLDLKPMAVPEMGLALSEKLAEILGVGPGDRVWVETMDHHRRHFLMPVTAIEQGYLGLYAHAEYGGLSAQLGDGRAVTAVDLAIDTGQIDALYERLKESPSIASVTLLRASRKKLRDTLAENLNIMMTVYTVLAIVITFGVVYNSARVQLSERARELASLRVMGFTTAEVSWVLLGEIALIVAIAVPLSFGLGAVFTAGMLSGFETELYRIPFAVSRSTFGWTAVIVIATAVVSALMVRSRIDQLNLIAVLKTRE